MTARRVTAFLVGALALGLPLTGCGDLSRAGGDGLSSPMPVNEAEGAAGGGGVGVRLDRASGSGCPQGTATDGGMNTENEFLVDFEEFAAQGGQGVEALQRLRSCTVDLAVHVPEGWRASIEKIGYEGDASGVRPKGATAHLGAKWWVAGAKDTLGQENLTVDAGALVGGSWGARAEPPVAWLNGSCAATDSQLRLTTTLRVDVPQSETATIEINRARLRLRAEQC